MPPKRKAEPTDGPLPVPEEPTDGPLPVPEVLPEYDETPDPATATPPPLPVVRVHALVAAATSDNEYPADVKPVVLALVTVGQLDPEPANPGRFGKAAFAAYARWQFSLGNRGPAANGIPDKASLVALGARTGAFTVTN